MTRKEQEDKEQEEYLAEWSKKQKEKQEKKKRKFRLRRNRKMKYKVGDKVKVRSDLKCEEYYGGITFNFEMNKFKGMEITIARVNYGGYYEVLETPYNFTDEMLEPVEGMSAEEVLKTYTEFCSEHSCNDCPIQNLDTTYCCPDIRKEYPEDVVKVLKQWKAYHEKKEVEFACIVRVIEDADSGRRCVYEEDVTEVKDETFKMSMKRILEEYCKEHEGKFFTVYEEICRVKE